jgi:hypothetical protein
MNLPSLAPPRIVAPKSMKRTSKPGRLPKQKLPAARAAGPALPADGSFPVIAQDRPTSENFSMPESSIKAGDVDFILPLEEIAPMLITLVWTGNGNGRLAAKNGRPLPARSKIGHAALFSRAEICDDYAQKMTA